MTRHAVHRDRAVSPVHAKAAAIIQRAASNLDIPDEHWPHAAATVVLALPEVAGAFHAAELLAELGPRLAELDGHHQPREWAGSSTGYVCTAGCGAYPCEVRRALDGAQPAAAAS